MGSREYLRSAPSLPYALGQLSNLEQKLRGHRGATCRDIQRYGHAQSRTAGQDYRSVSQLLRQDCLALPQLRARGPFHDGEVRCGGLTALDTSNAGSLDRCFVLESI